MDNPKCKICRRLGVKLLLKGERCMTQKCAMIKRPYPPGMKAKKVRKSSSEYGRELREKQKLRNWYDLGERQFKKYARGILNKRGKVSEAGVLLLRVLESRLDNVAFRMGFFTSRQAARQAVSHGHFFVNGKKVDAPSYLVKKGDKISLKPSSKKKAGFVNIPTTAKNQKFPDWMKVDAQKIEGEIIGEPAFDQTIPPAEISSIFEYYSR